MAEIEWQAVSWDMRLNGKPVCFVDRADDGSFTWAIKTMGDLDIDGYAETLEQAQHDAWGAFSEWLDNAGLMVRP